MNEHDLIEDFDRKLREARITVATLTAKLAEAEAMTAIIIGERGGALTESERRDLIEDVADDALGLGPLQRLLDDSALQAQW